MLVGTGWTMLQRDATPAPVVSAGPQGTVEASLPAPVMAPPVQGSPRRIVVPALSVDAEVDPIRARGETLVPPTDPQRIGWWADGARPGDRTGTALLTGHTVHTGGGALDDLEYLDEGDRVEVSTTRGTIGYRVESVQTLSREEVATRHRELFDQGGAARLVLVTCEDWDGQAYQSSVIVTATPLGTDG
jgi:LPXTG-site transpeptidase (sortase) family protein